MVTVITGVLTAGKSTLMSLLKKWGYKPVIEYTTRPMRDGETPDVDYHFVDDQTFDVMEAAGEFAEILHVNTIFGLWKYGARKSDMVDGSLLVCGPFQMSQLLDSGISMISVLLMIDKAAAMQRAIARGDNIEEFNRRFEKDTSDVEAIRERMTLVLDGCNSVEENARLIDNQMLSHKSDGYWMRVDGRIVNTAQKITESEARMYMDDRGIGPHLRIRGAGMPKNPVMQIAWLLLNSSGCGFCKVCRDKPCEIKDGESCANNIANYIRECVHAEDASKLKE